MTPLSLKLALPAVQIAGALIISRRISWRAHPALIAYLAAEAVTRVLQLAGLNLPDWINIPANLAIRTAVVFEVLAFARIKLSHETRGIAVGLTLAASALAAGCTQGLTLDQRAYLFRSYCHLALCGSLLAVTIRRWLAPMLECRRHTVYRVGVAAWLLVVAVAGCFVKGGAGYAVFAYDRSTWQAVDALTYGALVFVVGGMTLAMWLTLPRPRAVARTGDAWIRREPVTQLRRAS